MKKAFLLLVLAIFGTTWAGAKISLPTFFSDNMVLQQNTEAAIWGWTDQAGNISITTTWTGVKVTVTPVNQFGWFVFDPFHFKWLWRDNKYTIQVNHYWSKAFDAYKEKHQRGDGL